MLRQVKKLKGFRPLLFVPQGVLFSKGYRLYLADHRGERLEPVAAVPVPPLRRLAGSVRLAARVLRAGLSLGCSISDTQCLIAEKRRLWRLDLTDRSIALDHEVQRGSRPLSITRITGVAGFDDVLCYGEYSNNVAKDPVNIWTRDAHGQWKTAYTFARGTIEHVHTVVPDPRRGLVWILTGDFGGAAGLWIARNNFTHVEPVLCGSQDYRCAWLHFAADRILYATDTQLQTNHLRELKLSAAGAATSVVSEINGSSIHACMVRDQLAFSTMVEPGLPSGNLLFDLFERKRGPGIKSNHAQLVIGSAEQGFQVAGSWKKDVFPPRLLQFGAISFPSGHNPTRFLYAYFTALAGVDDSTLIYTLDGSQATASCAE
jgi:hypothetical protein